ncbi:hypothetical protein EAH78_28610 [Pseudomonas arsenicoxydans]|uniref:Uncharacterized protein n=1 Tax=Pseudomonas arsenicoxydans TaxID=702115 RepID=A0A502HGJ6_9PSED|nr:hypothetical protein EAH78_28610 [Pseudomonas arsenicoxydans]
MGASLLAKAVDQSTLMLNLMASSRASPLPQVLGLPGLCVYSVKVSLLISAPGNSAEAVAL